MGCQQAAVGRQLMTKYPISYSDNQVTWPMFLSPYQYHDHGTAGHDTTHSNHCQQRHPQCCPIINVLLTFSPQLPTSGFSPKINNHHQSAGYQLYQELEEKSWSRDAGHQLFQIAINYIIDHSMTATSISKIFLFINQFYFMSVHYNKWSLRQVYSSVQVIYTVRSGPWTWVTKSNGTTKQSSLLGCKCKLYLRNISTQ